MMNRKSLLLFFLFVVVLMAQSALAANLTGKWEAVYMGHQVKAVAEQKGDNLSGVAYLYDPLGHKSTWHFKGTVNGNKVQAGHNDGHIFTGHIVSDGKMSGILQTDNGFRIPLDIYTAK
jgi:hypothetical protein